MREQTGQIKQRLSELYSFIGEMGAINNYKERGLADININLVFQDIQSRLSVIFDSIEALEKELPEDKEENEKD